MSGGGPKDTTVTNQTILPSWVTNQAQQNLTLANDVAAIPYQAYPGQTVAGLTPDQQAAYSWVRDNLGSAAGTIANANAAITGPNLTTTAQSLLNPYLGQVESYGVGNVLRAGQLAQNNLSTTAQQAGAFGGTRFGVESGVLSAETARQAGDLSAQIRSQGWNTAVNTALQQAQTVSGLAQQQQAAGLQSASALSSAGQQEQNQQQAEINAALQQWQDARDQPLQALAIREGALTSTPYGATTTSTQPVTAGNPLLGGLGGAASGAMIGNMIAPGIGTGIGAAAGGLLGLFGARL